MTIHHKTENDINTIRRLLQACQDRHDALKNEYATYSRMLHETEQALNRANTVSSISLKKSWILMLFRDTRVCQRNEIFSDFGILCNDF